MDAGRDRSINPQHSAVFTAADPPAFAHAGDAAATLDPELPARLARPQIAARAAARFAATFPGRVLYALKANPAPWLARAVLHHGVDGLEIASATEARLAHALAPDAPAAFMHPVKPRAAIAHAFHETGCRAFAVDHPAEWAKIQAVLGPSTREVEILVRIAVSNDGAALPLLGKFGADPDAAIDLLRAIRPHVRAIGVSFHVGSQNTKPETFRTAIAAVGAIGRRAGVALDVLNVGGGFPEAYPGHEPAAPDAYMNAIGEAAAAVRDGGAGPCALWCEPGRALAAAAESLLTTVELRKDDALYINDGGAGALFDAVHCGWRFPVRVFRDGLLLDGPRDTMRVFGPTCDSDDVLAHPIPVPADIREGDRIEFGMTGAYGGAMASAFNGFGRYLDAVVADDPWPAAWSAPMSDVASTAQGDPAAANLPPLVTA